MGQRIVALVTGGSRGIGRATCRELARHGYAVVAVGRDARALEETARLVAEDGGACTAATADIRDTDAVDRCVGDVLGRYGRVDVLVNNAGGGGPSRPTPIDRITDAEWDDMLRVNLVGAYHFCRAVVPGMQARRSGCIVNIASVAARQASALSGLVYTTAKTGLVGMARHLARELGPYNIRVNTVAPGLVLSKRVEAKIAALIPAESERLMERIPLRRFGSVDEVAAVVAFLASPAASYVHGAVIDVNGGLFMA